MAHPILNAQDALKTLLAARPAFTGVDIRDGQPTETEDLTADSAFWFGGVPVPEDTWASLGAGRRRITFNLEFTIAARQYGDEERATRAIVFALYEDLMTALKVNPSLTSTVQQTGPVSGRFDSMPIGPQQWGAQFVGSIACTSRAY